MKFRPYNLARLVTAKALRPLPKSERKRRPYRPLTWQPFRILLVGI
jgi:hypothetical protein